MQAVCVMRRTFDPRQLSSLRVVDHRLVADRVPLVKNEGDVRAIQLVKSSGLAFDVVNVGELDDITRVHLFVYGARDVWQLGDSPSSLVPEPRLAAIIAAHVRTLDDVHVVSLGSVEQDSGRDMLPGLVAARLGWELFSNVLSLRVEGQRAHVTQVTDRGTQEIDVALPICISADESCSVGRDPSDEYDLIETLEKRAARTADVGGALSDAELPDLSPPPERQPRPVVTLAPKAVGTVADMIRRFQA